MTDQELKRSVEEELNWERDIKSPTKVGVGVKDGIVTLSGHVESYTEKLAAEEAATRVAGVKAIVNELDVRLPFSSERTDEDIARAAANALDWTTAVPRDQIKVTVNGGWIILRGVVPWYFQKLAAEAAVRDLFGVKGVRNLIDVQPSVNRAVVKSSIEEALKRDAEIDAKSITVETSGSKVILKGKVRSWFEKQEAERVAWRAPGVAKVENAIDVAA
ncbi:MAG TPA: BON domain-containing protein [Terriglobia bacterium]|nr:BON domain-containing protein [Terriglobia bacterium]